MNVKLEISEDKELRDAVKDMIRGCVKSIAREEIRGIIEDVFRKEYGDGKMNLSASTIVSNEVRRVVDNSLRLGSYENEIKKMTKDIILFEVEKALKQGIG